MIRRTAALLSATAILASGAAGAVDVNLGQTTPSSTLRGGTSAAPRLSLDVRSLSEMRWDNVVRQETEISCAAASLATILNYYFGFPTDEDEMLQALYAEARRTYPPGTADEVIRRLGFNLRHIRDVAFRGGPHHFSCLPSPARNT